jgi:hypothetical protein
MSNPDKKPNGVVNNAIIPQRREIARGGAKHFRRSENASPLPEWVHPN